MASRDTSQLPLLIFLHSVETEVKSHRSLSGSRDRRPRRGGFALDTWRGFRDALRVLDGVRLRGFAAFLLLLAGAFCVPLAELVVFAWRSDVYSHVLLVPFISIWMIATRPRSLNVRLSSAWKPAVALVVVGAGFLLLRVTWLGRGAQDALEDRQALSTLSFIAFASAGAFFFLGTAFMKAVAFPCAFLVFLAPFPSRVLVAIEVFLQHASADVAYAMISTAGIPVLREGLYFKLPGLLLEVARECSGIRSTLVLFITSLFAGNMLLRSNSQRALLAFAVIPLAIFRNGFRILTLAWLSVKVDPDVIHSPLHTRGGPIFFALSLVPFGLLLIYLRHREIKKMPATRETEPVGGLAHED